MGQPFLYPSESESYIENFLRMSRAPTTPYLFDDAITSDVLLILHADHEQNCSTSTVRLVGSSGANIYVRRGCHTVSSSTAVPGRAPRCRQIRDDVVGT